MSTSRFAVIVASTMTLASCVQPIVRERGSTTAPARPGIGPTGGDRRPPNDLPRGDAASPYRAARMTVCRAGGIPSGYVAVNYIASRECMASGDSTKTANAAVLLEIVRFPIGQTVRMCADQVTPRGWSRIKLSSEDGVCPRDPNDKSTEPTVVEIMKRSDR